MNVASNSAAAHSGWGPVQGDFSTGGQWHQNEIGLHITYLELLAEYFANLSYSVNIQFLLSPTWVPVTVIHAIVLLVESGPFVRKIMGG